MTNQELIRNFSQTINTTPSVVAEEQYGTIRSVLVITNTSTGGQVITISPADQATAGSGVVLYPGGQYVDAMDSGYKPTSTRITAISDVAGGLIAIHERIIMKNGTINQ